MASEAGAEASGVDTSEQLIGLARRHAPDAVFYIADMENLPFPDRNFSVVTAFNSLHFAADPTRLIAEVIRVTEPDGKIVTTTRGFPSECDTFDYFLELGALLPPDTLSGRPDLSDSETLETLFTEAGLQLSPLRVILCPWEYPDLETALRGLLSTGPAVRAIQYSGRSEVTRAVIRSIDPYRRDDGSYLLNNTCHCLVATRAEY
ncbi:hypothetical protein GCM10010360_56760 [Streptomyces nogalater]